MPDWIYSLLTFIGIFALFWAILPKRKPGLGIADRFWAMLLKRKK